VPDLRGKVVFITGAARGQGRAHAVRLAAEGVNVIVTDICADIPAIPYPMATVADLDETVALVEKAGGRAVGYAADVRDRAALEASHAAGLAAFDADHADIVVANAGGLSYPSDEIADGDAFKTSIDVMLLGVWHTLQVTTPAMVAAGVGGSVILTSSSAALRGFVGGSAGADGYTAAKAGVVGLMQVYANILGPHRIRVNSIHPTGVNTGMVQSEAFLRWMNAAQTAPISGAHNTLPIDILEAEDVSDAVAWLAGDGSRYVTGMALRIDAGFVNS
jgi:SDR family mycofactocin-dependent oxidoreductase